TGRGGKVDVAGYKAAEAQLSSLRTRYTEALRASGQFDVVQTRLLTNTQNLTNRLRAQKLTIRDVARQWSGLKDVYRQQMAMQQMQVTQWRTDPFGKVDADIIMPRDVLDRPLKFRDNLRLMNAAISSSSTQLINWGKNTQWAGRQIMVGLTIPTAMFAAAAGSMAYAAENEMTRVMKVYDTTAQDMYGKEQELAQLRADSYAMAGQAANLYGVAVKDTLNVEADLAQTGLQGAELKKSTTEVLRIATLGELDYQQALQMTIALQNAFKMDSEELTNTLNFMNSVENATSLSIQDIAEATPRAASAMASLNMTAEEMVILLTAMKERGVDATEGANARKSGITRALRPTTAAIDKFAEHGIDIERIVQNAGGNLLEILRQIGQQAQDLEQFDLGQAMAELFGTYQFNRLNAALAGVTEGYGGVADESSQTAKAIAVSQQS